MNRFLTVLCVTLATFLFTPAGEAQPRGPNIVLFIGDDLGVGDIAPYGNAVVRTPNLTELAGESLRFTRAFAASPTCSPSRSAIFTGLMPFRNGAHANHTGIREGTLSLPHYLGGLGYRVALAGKLHVGPRDVLPFELIEGTNVPEPGKAGEGVLWTDLHMPPVDRWLAERSAAEPFMLVVADHSPHVIWPENADYDPAAVDVPSTHIDTPAYRASRARYYSDVTKMDANVGLLMESLARHGLAENTIFVFIADQGPQLAFGKWGLYDAGIQSPLLVRWPGRVAPGASTEALVSLVDLLPTFLEAAGGQAPEGIDGRSFLPVLEGRATTHHDEVFASHTGDNLMNRTPMRMLRTDRYKYILNLAPEVLYTTHMDLATDHDGGREYWPSWRAASFREVHAASVLWRYHNRPAEELYDLEADPSEVRNLAADPAYTRLLDSFRTRLADWRAEQGDTRTGPEEVAPRQPGPAIAPYIF